MSLPAFQHLEKKIGKQIRFLEMKKGAIGKHIERRFKIFDEKKDELGKKITKHLREFEQKRDDDFRFIRTWFEKPLAMGAVAPSGRVLARTMARYVDPNGKGPIIELGPGTGPVTDALIKNGVDPSRLVLVEFDPAFCRLLQERYPQATVVQGDAYSLRKLIGALLQTPAADQRSDGAACAERAVYPVHLRRGVADPDAAGECARRALGADLAQRAPGPCMGLSPGLSPAHFVC